MDAVAKLMEQEVQSTREAIESYPWEEPVAYAQWLVQSYHIARYSTRLVALAGGLVSFELEKFHNRFVDHAREERGHEKLLVQDLKELGFTVESFPCNSGAAAMYQTQFYWIQLRSPVSFMGYVLALEGLSAAHGPGLYRRLLETYGPKATRFIRVHADADTGHVKLALATIEGLQDSERQAVSENLRLSSAFYRTMLREARDDWARVGSRTAA